MATNNANNFSNPVAVSSGGSGLASLTTYAPLCGGTTSTSALQQATAGFSTSGSVLLSQGAGAIPQWGTNAAFNKIATLTASSSAFLTFDSTQITSTYAAYFIEFSQVLGSTSGASLQMQISVNGGSSYLGSGAQAGLLSNNYNSTTQTATSSTSLMILAASAGSGKTSGYMFINMPQSAMFSYVGRMFTQLGTSSTIVNYGRHSNTSTITNLRFVMSTGTIFSGEITLYGIKQ